MLRALFSLSLLPPFPLFPTIRHPRYIRAVHIWEEGIQGSRIRSREITKREGVEGKEARGSEAFLLIYPRFNLCGKKERRRREEREGKERSRQFPLEVNLIGNRDR